MAIFVLALAVLGLGLLVFEALMPGFGVAGVIGLIVEIVAIVLTGIYFGVNAALLMAAVVAVAGGTSIYLSFRSLKKGRLSYTGLVLNATESDLGSAGLKGMEGKIGTVVSALRPVGVADFAGDRYEVVAEGSFISTGTDVKVIRVDGNKLTVRPVA